MPATIDINRIKADATTPTEVLEVYTYLKIFMDQNARQKWIERRERAWDVMENDILTSKERDEMLKHKQEPFTINKCNKGVQGSCAIVTDQKPEIKFFPVGSSDVYVAELLKRAHDYVWAKNEGNDLTYDVTEESKVGGIGFFGASFDQSKGVYGAIINYEEPPDDLYWDKDSRKRDMSDTHIIKAKMRSKSYIKDKYENIQDAELYFEQGASKDSEKSSGITTGDNYAASAKENQTPDTQGQVYQEPENIWEIEAWMLKKEKEHWVVKVENGEIQPSRMQLEKDEDPEEKAKAEGGEYWKRIVEKRYRRIVVGKKLVDETVNPMGIDSDGDPVMGIIALPHQRTRTSFPMSPTNYAAEINKEKIKRRSQFIYAASQSIAAPIIEPPNVKWEGSPGDPWSRVIVPASAPFKPERMQSGAIDINRFVQLEELADRDIDDQYDLHDVMRGKIPAGQDNMAGRTVLALQDLGGMMSKPFLRKLESALVRLGKVNISLILKHWPRTMWERLLEDDEKAPDGSKEIEQSMKPGEDQDEVKNMVIQKYQLALERIRPSDPSAPPGITLLDLDVRLTAGSSMPTNRMAKSGLAMEMVKAGVYDAEAALEYVDDPLKDKLLIRLKNQQQMGMMQQK